VVSAAAYSIDQNPCRMDDRDNKESGKTWLTGQKFAYYLPTGKDNRLLYGRMESILTSLN